MIGPFLLALWGQAGKPVHPEHKAPATLAEDTRPVSAHEAATAFERVASLLKSTGGMSYGETAIPHLDRPVTRNEVVAEMNRLYIIATPALRFTPVPVRHDTSVFRIDASLRPALDRLVTFGYVARIGPLVVGPSPSLLPKELGDAIGVFMARVAQTTHTPNPKWTPILKSD